MLLFLRIVGVTNAAIWFGATVFFTLVTSPAFSTPEMAKLLPASHSGAVAHLLQGRYYTLHHWCGVVAIAHLMIEYLYAGKPLRKWVLYLAIGLFSLGLIGGVWVHPKLKRMHLEIYGVRSTPQQRQQAAKSYSVWNGFGQTVNVIVLLGLGVFAYQIASSGTSTRFSSTTKFRG